MMTKIIDSYDIIAQAVLDYMDWQNDSGRPIDIFYIVTFKQSYHPVRDFETCTEIVEVNENREITFFMDFCEGQKYVTDVNVKSLDEVGIMMRDLYS